MATNFLINGSEFSDNFIPRDAFTTGGLWTWGDNTYGQTGETPYTVRYTPGQISGNNWLSGQRNSGGSLNASGIKTDGTLWVWGTNDSGSIGDGTRTSTGTPVNIPGNNWKQICSTTFGGRAIKTDGTLWVWGDNGDSRLGDNTSTAKSSPVQTAAGGTNWKMVSGGYSHSAAIKTDNTLWVWGGSYFGQLGDGTQSNKSSPIQIAGTTWKEISCGTYFTAAIKTDNTLWSWGRNQFGQLGDGTTTQRNSPVQIAGTTWKFVSDGRNAASAIKTDGTLWVWGDNDYGQIGDGTTTPKSSPVQTVAGGTNWKSVSNGDYMNVGIKTDGTLWTWGYNGTGCLGDNTTTPKSSPIQTTAGGTNWKSAYCSTVTGYGWVIALRDNS
jgi:alpha-tubulin suppressor-like RCC1 family protein